jgi:hypothetical protein
MSAKPQRVVWKSSADLECAIMGALGFSTKFIGERTGLTPCQISYRLKRGDIRRSDYRNGTSRIALRVINKIAPRGMTGQIRKELKLKLKEPCAK